MHEKLASLTLLRDFIFTILQPMLSKGGAWPGFSSFLEAVTNSSWLTDCYVLLVFLLNLFQRAGLRSYSLVLHFTLYSSNPSRSSRSPVQTSHATGDSSPATRHRNLRHASPPLSIAFPRRSKQKTDQYMGQHVRQTVFPGQIRLQSRLGDKFAGAQWSRSRSGSRARKVPDLRHQHVSHPEQVIQIRATDYHSSGNHLCNPTVTDHASRCTNGLIPLPSQWVSSNASPLVWSSGIRNRSEGRDFTTIAKGTRSFPTFRVNGQSPVNEKVQRGDSGQYGALYCLLNKGIDSIGDRMDTCYSQSPICNHLPKLRAAHKLLCYLNLPVCHHLSFPAGLRNS
nr:hypothetical protein Iba_chr08aCG12990 [Ipomoea batatas]